MKEYLKFYINGEWVDPVEPRTLEVENPATEESYARISLGSKADVDKAPATGEAKTRRSSRRKSADQEPARGSKASDSPPPRSSCGRSCAVVTRADRAWSLGAIAVAALAAAGLRRRGRAR